MIERAEVQRVKGLLERPAQRSDVVLDCNWRGGDDLPRQNTVWLKAPKGVGQGFMSGAVEAALEFIEFEK